MITHKINVNLKQVCEFSLQCLKNLTSPLIISFLDIVYVLVPHVLAAFPGRDVRELAPLPVAVGLAPEIHAPALLDCEVLGRGGRDVERMDDGGCPQDQQEWAHVDEISH